jgi:hypothetical protein
MSRAQLRENITREERIERLQGKLAALRERLNLQPLTKPEG